MKMTMMVKKMMMTIIEVVMVTMFHDAFGDDCDEYFEGVGHLLKSF